MMVQIRKIEKELKDEKILKDCARKFGLLGDLTKMRICYLLCHYPQLSVSEIAKILKMPVSRVSHALRKLRKAGFVSVEKNWRERLYSLKNKKLVVLIDILK